MSEFPSESGKQSRIQRGNGTGPAAGDRLAVKHDVVAGVRISVGRYIGNHPAGSVGSANLPGGKRRENSRKPAASTGAVGLPWIVVPYRFGGIGFGRAPAADHVRAGGGK